MRHLIALLVVSVAVAGCAAPPQVSSFTRPDGRTVNRVKCNVDAAGCFQAATATCGGGSYQVLDSRRYAGAMGSDILPGPIPWFAMSYVCGPSDGRMPGFPLVGPPPLLPAPVYSPQPSR